MKKILIFLIALFQITAVFPSYAQSTEAYTFVSGDSM